MRSGSVLSGPGDTLPKVEAVIRINVALLERESCSCGCYRYLVEVLSVLIDLLP
jgi:hypothetical protein